MGFAFMVIDYADGVTPSSVGLSSLSEMQRTHLYDQLAISLPNCDFMNSPELDLSLFPLTDRDGPSTATIVHCPSI